jgi:RNA polymerase sigma-70 factor (ECF subfamily)
LHQHLQSCTTISHEILVEGSVSLQSTATDSCDPLHLADGELVRVTVCGDHRGYELLTRRYQNRLFKSILRQVGCVVAAEEIVQDAFVRAFLSLGSFQRKSNFYTWLYRIALNSCRTDFRRQQKMRPLESMGQDFDLLASDHEARPSDSVERAEERTQVREAMERLDESYRTILILREFEGFDYQAIADVLEIKVGTVRSRLSRARQQLRSELSAYLNAKSSGPSSSFTGDCPEQHTFKTP